MKDRRQKTLAAKQAELQSDLRDQVALLQAAMTDRVRTVSFPPCPLLLLPSYPRRPPPFPSPHQREAMNRKIKSTMTDIGNKIRLLEERWKLTAGEWLAGTRRKLRSKEREDALDSAHK